MNFKQQLSTLIFFQIMFSGSDFNLIAFAVIGISLLLKKSPPPHECKIYDFEAEKARRQKRHVSYQKAA